MKEIEVVVARKVDVAKIQSELAALIDGLAVSDDLVDSYRKIGRCYVRLRELDSAEEWCQEALSLGPMDPWTHLYLGAIANAKGQHKTALDFFTRAAELLPEEAVSFWSIGSIYEAMGESGKAGEFYRRACRVDPQSEEAKSKLEAWQHKQRQKARRKEITQARDDGHAATAAILAERWLADRPNDIGVISILVDALSEMNRYQAARHVLEAAIERVTGEDVYHLLLTNMGQMCRYHGDFAEAEQWFQKAIDANPDDAGNYILLGAVQARHGKLKSAEKMHRRATGCSKGYIDEAFHNLGLVLRGQGRLAESAECFRRAIAITADYEGAIVALKDVEEAMSLVDRKVEMMTLVEGFPPHEIMAASGGSRAATCVALAEQWLAEHPEDKETIFEYAEMLYLLTRYDQAITLLKTALEGFGEDRWRMLRQLGELHWYRGNFHGAECWYRMAIDEKPNNAWCYMLLSETQARRGHLAAAEETLRRATRCTEDSLDEIYCNLGLVLRGLERFEEAADWFRKAIELHPEYEAAIVALEDITRAIALGTQSPVE